MATNKESGVVLKLPDQIDYKCKRFCASTQFFNVEVKKRFDNPFAEKQNRTRKYVVIHCPRFLGNNNQTRHARRRTVRSRLQSRCMNDKQRQELQNIRKSSVDVDTVFLGGAALGHKRNQTRLRCSPLGDRPLQVQLSPVRTSHSLEKLTTTPVLPSGLVTPWSPPLNECPKPSTANALQSFVEVQKLGKSESEPVQSRKSSNTIAQFVPNHLQIPFPYIRGLAEFMVAQLDDRLPLLSFVGGAKSQFPVDYRLPHQTRNLGPIPALNLDHDFRQRLKKRVFGSLLRDFHLRGDQSGLVERVNVLEQIKNLRSLILPEFARELYWGRTIKLPAKHTALCERPLRQLRHTEKSEKAKEARKPLPEVHLVSKGGRRLHISPSSILLN